MVKIRTAYDDMENGDLIFGDGVWYRKCIDCGHLQSIAHHPVFPEAVSVEGEIHCMMMDEMISEVCDARYFIRNGEIVRA